MSLRPSVEPTCAAPAPHAVRGQLEEMRLAHLKAEAESAANAAAASMMASTSVEEPPCPDACAFDRLTPVERSAASLGVHPEALKPIGFMNHAHFASLLKNNAVSGDLARGIESFKAISQFDAAAM